MKNRGGEKKGGRSFRLLGPALALAAAAAWAAWSLHALTAAPQSRAADYACQGQGRAVTLAEVGGHAPQGVDQCPDAVRYIVGRRMDLNRATEAELDLLPGIGAESARRIIEFREQHGGFRGRADFSRIPGLGREARVSLETWADVK
ncbi:MAG TPA: helix-hairpin-helix domain-containing protein [bacterium]|nr:helix-hairpin-helix domain-containing protein [bacterium]